MGTTTIGNSIRTYKRAYTVFDYAQWLSPLYRAANLYPLTNLVRERVVPPCILGVPVSNYLNREDVRTALHIPEEIQSWGLCVEIDYQSVDNNGNYGS